MMKIIKLSIVVLLLVLLLVARLGFSRDITPEILGNKGVLIHTIGNDELLCVINTGYENGAYWFLVSGTRNNREIGHNLSQLAEVSQLMVSPDKKYLAVLSVGEGHPMVEVIDLKKLLAKNKYTALHVIDPYPGTLSIERWDGSKLIVNSDVPLTQRKENGRVDPDSILPEVKTFALNVLTGAMESINTGIKNPK